MDPRAKPGWLLVINSVVAIALCAFFVSFTLTMILIPTTDPGLAWIFLLLAPAAYCQYRGTFCRDGRAALLAGYMLLVGALVFAVPGIMMGIAFARGLSDWIFVVTIAGLAAYLTFVVWLDLRWSKSLSPESHQQPNRAQFSIRDLLAITVWLAAVAGLTRWMVVRGM